MWRFVIDEDVPRRLSKELRAKGHEADHVIDLGLRGSPDETVFAYAQEMGAAIITADKEFGDPRAYPPHKHNGIILLRIPDSVPAEARIRLVHDALREIPDEHLSTLLVVVTLNRVRIRRLGS